MFSSVCKNSRYINSSRANSTDSNSSHRYKKQVLKFSFYFHFHSLFSFSFFSEAEAEQNGSKGFKHTDECDRCSPSTRK
uniref:Uncharacterized protein n=1 Tax=Arundo donax TaxID=35708 RepID=A0A0A8YN03_ARUDO